MLIGTAVEDITPKTGIELSGFAVRKQPSDHIIDPLYCKVIYMEAQGIKYFWIQLDLIGVEAEFVQKVRLSLSFKFNIPATNFIIAATHTHSGPGTLPLNYCGEYRPDFLLNLEKELENCCEKATENPDACFPMFGKVPFELAIDRRENDKKNVDPYLRYLAFLRPDKTAKAILWNYAMHPVCLRGTGISADYPGIVCDEVSKNLPGKPLSVFGLGPCGNINPPETGTSGQLMKKWAIRIAQTLTGDVLNRLKDYKPSSDSLRFMHKNIKLNSTLLSPGAIDAYAKQYYTDDQGVKEFGPVFFKAVGKWAENMKMTIRDQGSELPIEIFCLTIGDTKILGVSAEVFSTLVKLIDHNNNEQIMLITCVNGAQGYLPDLQSYDTGGYETNTSCFFYNQLPPQEGSLEKVAYELGKMLS